MTEVYRNLPSSNRDFNPLPKDYPVNPWTSFKSKDSNMGKTFKEALISLECKVEKGDRDQLVVEFEDLLFEVSMFESKGVSKDFIIEIQRLEGDGYKFFDLYRNLLLRIQKHQPCVVNLQN